MFQNLYVIFSIKQWSSQNTQILSKFLIFIIKWNAFLSEIIIIYNWLSWYDHYFMTIRIPWAKYKRVNVPQLSCCSYMSSLFTIIFLFYYITMTFYSAFLIFSMKAVYLKFMWKVYVFKTMSGSQWTSQSTDWDIFRNSVQYWFCF